MSREKIIETAHSQLGVSENPPGTNKNPYGKWYGFDGYAWCAMFVSWVYDKAGHPLGHIDDAKGYRDCNSAYWKWKASNQLTNDPEKGDIVLFDWEGDGKCNHTGIFHEWADAAKNTFWAYEGNTAVGNDSNGGTVMRRKRYKSTVKAFVKPNVLTGVSSAAAQDDVVLQMGDKGSDVTQLQKNLHTLGYTITVDGHFGKETKKIVEKFQRDNKLKVTGTVTHALLGFIEGRLSGPDIAPGKLITGSFLQMGNSGQPVVLLQKALNKAGITPKVEPDGVFGEKTYKAVIKFQKSKKLKADGIAGPQTLAALGIS